MRTPSLFESERLTLRDALQLTAGSLMAYGSQYHHWAIAFSGGKDSTATVTAVNHLIESGSIPAPETLTVLYADTRMEMPPLQIAALNVLDTLARRGVRTQVVLPALDDRYFVYMFGRGVPPPKNRFRWCTSQLKIEPMMAALSGIREQAGEKLLMLTGVRLGESAARDTRIALSCSRDGAECGQGWFQEATPDSVADTLAPLLHWRICHVWDWLTFDAPTHGFDASIVAEVYGQGTETEEVNARTGCVGCNLTSRDTSLDRVLRLPQWAYLAPLKRLKPLYRELTKTQYRLRKDGSERRKDGALMANPMRLGPLTFEARRYGLSVILAAQAEVNAVADTQGRPRISLINDEELARVHELIAAETWPNGWAGDEVRGDVSLDQVIAEGVRQPLLAALEATS